MGDWGQSPHLFIAVRRYHNYALRTTHYELSITHHELSNVIAEKTLAIFQKHDIIE